ncbi:acyl-CoA dehydrogenase family protein [Corynebacterium lizhenjunii]|uniref:Acyl-CoA dehydrogenase family protein n=1 Tax=Corynebacterium lizhenjunii TaxID=2709394 RepID=A0A7T0PBQ1_9CORY|nr:acyl-CoA dehydrogenase family protein [Corynebacterium lizhenjunii]QPK79665.1 acyl-CoA dehydrogenase family protein [Corynebacterium lizhenjunii]
MSHNLFAPTTDFLGVFDGISAADAAAWARAAKFGAECVGDINEHWQNAHYPLDIVRELGQRDLMTDGVAVPGHEQLSPIGAGLVLMEVTRADASMGTVIAVQAGLALRSIAMLGSEEHKKTYLEPLASCELLGAFALTEPAHGSDSIGLETTAVRDGDHFVLNGEKKWIGNGATGGMTQVFARLENGEVSGFIVPQDTPGYSAEVITGKLSLRSIHQTHIKLQDCRVPVENQLPGAQSFKDVARVLTATRVGVAWMALGSAVACFEKARDYVLEREQFGRELARTQIIQQRLSNMSLELAQMMLICREVSQREADGTMAPEQASMAKLHNTRAARRIASDCRDMLGGVGILLENDIARHFADVEAMHTYEGTDTVQSLIIGKKLTGFSAYK